MFSDHTCHHVRIAGLADPGDAPALDPDVRLPDAGPVDDERVRDHAIEGGLVRDAARLPQAVAQHLAATELALVAVDRRRRDSTSAKRFGVAQPHAVAGRSDRRCLRSGVDRFDDSFINRGASPAGPPSASRSRGPIAIRSLGAPARALVTGGPRAGHRQLTRA